MLAGILSVDKCFVVGPIDYVWPTVSGSCIQYVCMIVPSRMCSDVWVPLHGVALMMCETSVGSSYTL